MAVYQGEGDAAEDGLRGGPMGDVGEGGDEGECGENGEGKGEARCGALWVAMR